MLCFLDDVVGSTSAPCLCQLPSTKGLAIWVAGGLAKPSWKRIRLPG